MKVKFEFDNNVYEEFKIALSGVLQNPPIKLGDPIFRISKGLSVEIINYSAYVIIHNEDIPIAKLPLLSVNGKPMKPFKIFSISFNEFMLSIENTLYVYRGLIEDQLCDTMSTLFLKGIYNR